MPGLPDELRRSGIDRADVAPTELGSKLNPKLSTSGSSGADEKSLITNAFYLHTPRLIPRHYLRTDNAVIICIVLMSLQLESKYCTYKSTKGNHVVFYNDASEDAQGTRGAFADISEAIDQAKHFIFIADWSFHPYLRLKPSLETSLSDTIGAVLLKKAQKAMAKNEKFLIAIHAWDHTAIGASDKQNDSGNVQLKKIADTIKINWPLNLFWLKSSRSGVNIGWSHHQKFIVLDAPEKDGKRNPSRRLIKVFVGGLDLTKGRFDWSEHLILPNEPKLRPLKQAINGQDNWYNPEFNDNQTLPRMPWHDVHMQLIGPSAWDFVREFVGRWNSVLPSPHVEGLPNDQQTDKLNAVFQSLFDRKTFIQQWELHTGELHAQVFRSMTSLDCGMKVAESIETPTENKGTKNLEFKWKLEENFEQSIYFAYKKAIESAKHFIYIENQYLIGSFDQEVGEKDRFKIKKPGDKIKNQIPQLLVDQIIKNKNGSFHVYVISPLFSEGDPLDSALQIRIRFWATVSYMIRKLQANNVDWKRYLSFYFLANWTNIGRNMVKPREFDLEKMKNKLSLVDSSPLPNDVVTAAVAKALRTQIIDSYRKSFVSQNQRYQIYVHSKFMIVDDRYVIIGSANLNERSLSGDRDSEIAVGLWQEEGANKQPDYGYVKEIRDIRERLMKEHLNLKRLPTKWENPGDANFVNEVLKRARINYRDFMLGEKSPRNGHLCLFPVQFLRGMNEGKIKDSYGYRLCFDSGFQELISRDAHIADGVLDYRSEKARLESKWRLAPDPKIISGLLPHLYD